MPHTYYKLLHTKIVTHHIQFSVERHTLVVTPYYKTHTILAKHTNYTYTIHTYIHCIQTFGAWSITTEYNTPSPHSSVDECTRYCRAGGSNWQEIIWASYFIRHAFICALIIQDSFKVFHFCFIYVSYMFHIYFIFVSCLFHISLGTRSSVHS